MTFSKRSSLYKESLKVTSAILTNLQRLPGGYVFWHGLKPKGKFGKPTTLHRWTLLFLTQFFTQAFLDGLLRACLSNTGTPEAKGDFVYQWLLKYIYKNDSVKLFTAWVQLQGAEGQGAPVVLHPPSYHEGDR